MAKTYVPTFVRQVRRQAIYVARYGSDINANIGLISPAAQTAYLAYVTALNNMQQFETVLLPLLSGDPEQFIT